MGLKLIGEVALDGSGFERGLARLSSGAVSGFKGMLVQAFGIYGIEQAFVKTIERAGELVDASKRLGIGIEQLQLLKQAANDAGTDLQRLAPAFEKIEIARAKALGGGPGSADALKAFSKFGISKDQLKTQSREDLFTGPMSSAMKTTPQADLAVPMKEIFGKGFGDLIPVLQTDFDGLRKHMEALGAVMSTETALVFHELGNEMNLLSQVLVTQFAPAILWAAETIYTGLGRLVANPAAKLGAGTAHMGVVEGLLATAKLVGYGAAGLYKRATGESEPAVRKWIQSKAAGAGLDVPAMQGAGKAAEDSWMKPLDNFKKAIAEEGEKLKHPKKPTFKVPNEAKEEKSKGYHERSDALLRVGNFLGSSVIEGIANRQLTVLQQIADNTRPSQGNEDTTSYPPV